MDCSEVKEKLNLYVDGMLDDAEKQSLEAHAASCPQCGKALSDALRLKRSLASLGEVEPPAGLAASAMRKAKRRHVPWYAYSAAAAAAVVALAFALSPLMTPGGVNMKSLDEEIAYSQAAGAAEDAQTGAESDGSCPLSETLRMSGTAENGETTMQGQSADVTESAEASRDMVTVSMAPVIYLSETEYADALRAAGATSYYRFPTPPEGATLLQIVAGDTAARWEYTLSDGSIIAFEWLSAHTEEDVQRWDEQLTLRSDNTAHSFSHSNGMFWSSEARINENGETEATDGTVLNVYWGQLGAAFHAELPASFTEEQMLACCTVEQVVL